MLSGKPRVMATMVAALLSLPAFGAAASALDDANERARRHVRQIMQDQRIPGLQIAVVRDRRLVLSESYGLANVENAVPVTNTTLFPINSATKSFTGVAMTQLAEAGLVDLEAPVSRYLNDLPQAWRAVRVRQLLAHTSGLPDVVGPEGMVDGLSEPEAWKAIRDRPMDAPTGERFIYNQTNYGLLSRIIAQQSKMTYERYLRQRQFAVAGMRLTTFGDSYDLVPHAATMYSYFPRGTIAENDANRLSRWFYDIPPSLWAGGGIQTTADELAAWIIALSDDKLISATGVRGMWTPEKLNSGADGAWAAGWPVLAPPPHRQVAGIGGARAAFVVYPDDGLAIVVLTNLVGANPERFIPEIADIYRPAPNAAKR